jgi:prepilin-type N-terminal cleavage/methylation domain-containing protein
LQKTDAGEKHLFLGDAGAFRLRRFIIRNKEQAMRVTLIGSDRRRGLSLLEMTTALTISAIIAGVLLAGATKIVCVASNILAVWEIAQLNDAVEDFAAQFGEYPPDFHDPADAVRFMQQHFPKCPSANYPSFAGQNPASALYFWLAGPDGRGYSTDPTNPFGNGVRRISPFIRFAENRLKKKDGVTQYFPPQIGGSGAPYVYFRAGMNGYQGNCGYSPARPYRDSTTGNWINAESFQILCAGQDGVYGSGNHFPAGADYDKFNLDDISNFSRAGTMQQAMAHTGQTSPASKPQGKRSSGQ